MSLHTIQHQHIEDLQIKTNELKKIIINKIKDIIVQNMYYEKSNIYTIAEESFEVLLGYGIPINLAIEICDISMAKARVQYEINRLNKLHTNHAINVAEQYTYTHTRFLIKEEVSQLKEYLLLLEDTCLTYH